MGLYHTHGDHNVFEKDYNFSRGDKRSADETKLLHDAAWFIARVCMSKRATLLIALTVAVALAPRVYLTAETAADVFPIAEGAIAFVDLQFTSWFRAPFIAAHACAAWLVVLMFRGSTTLSHKILTLILLGEMTTIYLIVLRFWYSGVEVSLY